MSELSQTQPQSLSKKTIYLLILVFILPFTMAVLLHFFDLKPGGKIIIADVVHQAIAREGFIDKGTVVEVTAQHSFGLVVKRLVV